MALPLSTRQRVFSLVKGGATYRAVAERVGVSKSTVDNIMTRGRAELPSDLNEKIDSDAQKTCHLYRCPGCGHLVYFVTCLICSIRASNPHVSESEGRKRREEEPTAEEIDNDKRELKAEHMRERRRYTEYRWYPSTFNTPVYSLSETEEETK